MHFDYQYWYVIFSFVVLVNLLCLYSVVWKLNIFKKALKNTSLFGNLPSWFRRLTAIILYFVAISFCSLAISEPFIYISKKTKQYENIRLIFLVDVSRSMVYAEDIPPNRLEAVKREMKRFYSSLDGFYESSILPFAGEPNPYFCPLTHNRATFLEMLDELSWRSAPALGTDLTKALEAVQELYVKQDKIDQSGLNIVVLLSDGGKEEALATDRVRLVNLTKELASKNFRFYTIGVGGNKPAPLIVRNDDGQFFDFVKENGKNSYSLLDKEILVKLASVGKGAYYDLNTSSNLVADLHKVLQENRKVSESNAKKEKLSLKPYLFSVSIFMIIVAMLLNKV